MTRTLRSTTRLALVVVALSWIGVSSGTAQTSNVPVDPIEAILEAFTSHDLVALNELHMSEQAHAFRVSLIRDPRFAAVVDDIVVEFGNSLYQDVIDRYVTGEDVPYDELRRVWQNTGETGTIWDRPIYEDFFRVVRTVNAQLPRERHLRVVLAGFPIDWNGSEYEVWEQRMESRQGRQQNFTDVIRREVIAKERRALLHFGAGHIQHIWPSSGIVARLENEDGIHVFTVGTDQFSPGLATLQADVARWEVPTITLLRGTAIGATRFRVFAPIPEFMQARDPAATLAMEDQFDAVLYLGAVSALTISRLDPDLCRDPEYLEMRLARMATTAAQPLPPGVELSPADELKEYCANVTP
jgi:hypothetical protein